MTARYHRRRFRMHKQLVSVFSAMLALSPAAAQTDFSPQALNDEAQRVSEVVTHPAATEWLEKAGELPEAMGAALFIGPREPGGFEREVYTAQQALALSEEELADFRVVEYGPDRYYATNYGSPIAYAPMLELAALHAGIESFKGQRILDLGYGQLGQLEMLARCGAKVVGIEIDPVIDTLYRTTRLSDQVQAADGTRGRVRLLLGDWFNDWDLQRDAGPGFDIILCRNVLKRGYVQPEEPMPGFDPIDVGGEPVDGALHIFHALNEGGIAVVYNLGAGYHRRDDGSYHAPADIRDPFGEDAWKEAGFEILAFEEEGSDLMREVGVRLGWGTMDELADFNVLYTIVRRPE